MSHKDVREIHEKNADYTTGFVYDDPQYQQLCVDVAAQILKANYGDEKPFFPSCSNKNLLAYECLIKTVNQLMGFALFTHREQGIRLIMKHCHYDFEAAAIEKMKGGVPFEAIRDFAVDEDSAYSFDLLTSFDYFPMMEINSAVKEYCPGKEVLRFVKEMMLDQPLHAKLLIVLKGKASKYFQHALCFVRRDFGSKKQLLIMDCKNYKPMVYPTIYDD